MNGGGRSWMTSLWLPPVSDAAGGMPWPSVRGWCLLPVARGRPGWVRFRVPAGRGQARGVDHCPGPVRLVRRPQLFEQRCVQPVDAWRRLGVGVAADENVCLEPSECLGEHLAETPPSSSISSPWRGITGIEDPAGAEGCLLTPQWSRSGSWTGGHQLDGRCQWRPGWGTGFRVGPSFGYSGIRVIRGGGPRRRPRIRCGRARSREPGCSGTSDARPRGPGRCDGRAARG